MQYIRQEGKKDLATEHFSSLMLLPSSGLTPREISVSYPGSFFFFGLSSEKLSLSCLDGGSRERGMIFPLGMSVCLTPGRCEAEEKACVTIQACQAFYIYDRPLLLLHDVSTMEHSFLTPSLQRVAHSTPLWGGTMGRQTETEREQKSIHRDKNNATLMTPRTQCDVTVA